MNEEEALEIFKNLILLPYDWKITDKYKGTINFIGSLEGNEAIQTILNLIEKLSKENEQLRTEVNSLKKENEELKFKERSRIIGKYGEVEIHDVINRTLSNDYIPVQKIKEKIEELDKEEKRELKGTKGQDRYYIKQKYMYKRKVLEELLREE